MYEYTSPRPLSPLTLSTLPLLPPSRPTTPSTSSPSRLHDAFASLDLGAAVISPDQVDLGTFIVERLLQVGVGSVFGVPGDFNLGFLDYIEDEPDLEWIGTCSELNAGYAADGYARVKGDLAVCITTFGVGELSALNALAGSRAEHLPILHIVGYPSTLAITSQKKLHHTLGNGDYEVFGRMASGICGGDGVDGKVGEGCVVLGGEDGEGWVRKVDEAIRFALRERRPAYLGLPQDLVPKKVPSKYLLTPIREPFPLPSYTCRTQMTSLVTDIIDNLLTAKKPMIIADFYADRFGFGEEVREIVRLTGARSFGTQLAKSLLDEQHPGYGGLYSGNMSIRSMQEDAESCDFCLMVGKFASDMNTGVFTWKLPPNTVEINRNTVTANGKTYSNMNMKDMLLILISTLRNRSGFPLKLEAPPAPKVEAQSGKLKHESWWTTMESFFRDEDLIVSDVGTCSFGLMPKRFPTSARMHAQHLWCSIGWSVGAVLGATVAKRELSGAGRGRTILVVGDGALQMTIQDFGTLIRNRLPVYIFINVNDGYEIERQIHGDKAKYNDIQPWNHALILKGMAGPDADFVETYRIGTTDEANKLMTDEAFLKPGKLRLVEVCLPRDDVPALLATAKESFNVPAKSADWAKPKILVKPRKTRSGRSTPTRRPMAMSEVA